MANSEPENTRRPGPRRPPGAPVGPDEVRRAVFDAAASLFAERGVDRVPLRDIAEAAGTHLALIGRYIGSRDELVLAVFDDLSTQVAADVRDHPLEGQGFGIETVMGKWARLAGALAIAQVPLAARSAFNPVGAMADTLSAGYGLDDQAALLRSMQVVALALGWRIFEDYLITAGDLEDVSLESLRDELRHTLRRIGATPLPSPPDPTARAL